MLGRFTTRKVADAEVPSMTAEMDAPSFLDDLPAIAAPDTSPETAGNPLLSAKLLDAKVRLHRRLIEEINLDALAKLPEEEMKRQIHGLVSQYPLAERLPLNSQELDDFVAEIL